LRWCKSSPNPSRGGGARRRRVREGYRCKLPLPETSPRRISLDPARRKVTPATMSDPVDHPTPRRKPKPEVTRVGGRTLKPSTLMMGYGYDPQLSEGALKPPIFLTSTFAFESAEAGKRHF